MVTGMWERIGNSRWVKRLLILEGLTAFGALVVGGIVAAIAVIGGFLAWVSDVGPLAIGVATLAFALAAAIGIPIAIRVQTKLNELREDHARALELIEKTRGDLLGKIQASQASLQAHQMLYALDQIMPKINRLTEALEKPNRNPEDTNWAEWDATYQEWRSLLGDFAKTLPASWQIAADLWSNPGDLNHSDKRSLDEDKYPMPHEFKTFCIYRDNYNKIRGGIIPILKRDAKVSIAPYSET